MQVTEAQLPSEFSDWILNTEQNPTLTGGWSEATRALESEVAVTTSFEFVFNNYFSFVSKLARALLLNAQDAEDVTQEVFLRVYKNLSTYDPRRGSLNAWLGKLTVNACRTHQRRTFLQRLWKPASQLEDADSYEEAIDPSVLGAPEEYALQGELRKIVTDVLAKMRPKHRTVLVLHHYLDLSCVEIAAILDCAEGTVYSRLHYARRSVQDHLEKHLQLTEGGPEA